MNNTETIKLTKKCVSDVLKKQGFVSIVDVFIAMGKLDKKDHEDWRFKRVPYLEKVIRVNLKKATLINKTIRSTCLNDYQLKPSKTVYRKWGKGKNSLRFSKSGLPKIEELYATHYVSKKLRKESVEKKNVKKLKHSQKNSEPLDNEDFSDFPFDQLDY